MGIACRPSLQPQPLASLGNWCSSYRLVTPLNLLPLSVSHPSQSLWFCSALQGPDVQGRLQTPPESTSRARLVLPSSLHHTALRKETWVPGCAGATVSFVGVQGGQSGMQVSLQDIPVPPDLDTSRACFLLAGCLCRLRAKHWET